MKGIEEREEADIATFTPEELREYEDSLKTYRDLKNSLDTAEEKEAKMIGLTPYPVLCRPFQGYALS